MLEIYAGRGPEGWGQPRPRLVPQPSKGQECAVHCALAQSLPDLPGEGGLHTDRALRRAVDRSCHGASVSPDRERGVLAFAQKAAWGAPRRRVLMLQECGKQRVAKSCLELLEFVAFPTIAS